MCFSCFLKMAGDSAAGIEWGRSFQQEGTFNVKVLESDCGEGGVVQRSLQREKELMFPGDAECTPV